MENELSCTWSILTRKNRTQHKMWLLLRVVVGNDDKNLSSSSSSVELLRSNCGYSLIIHQSVVVFSLCVALNYAVRVDLEEKRLNCSK